jgi:hypothetical protein
MTLRYQIRRDYIACHKNREKSLYGIRMKGTEIYILVAGLKDFTFLPNLQLQTNFVNHHLSS